MRVLVASNMYPGKNSHLGIFIKQQVEQLEAEGLEIIRVVKNRKGSFAYFPFILKYIVCLLFNSYDIIHAYYGFHSALPAAIIKRKPLIITFVGSDALREPSRNSVYRILQRFVVTRADHIIAVSNQVRNVLIDELGGKFNKISLISFGVDFDLFKPIPREIARRQLGLPFNKKLVLFPSSPKRIEKRFDIFKKAIELLQEDSHDISPVILSNNGRPYSEVPLVMNACDVLVLTSDSEGSPTVIKEAMACNLPIVSVDVGDVGEMIKNTKNCHICRRDPVDIAETVGLALKQAIRTKGREKIGHLSSKKISAQIISLYKRITEANLCES